MADETLKTLRAGFDQSMRIDAATRITNECVRRGSKIKIDEIEAGIFRKRDRQNEMYLNVSSLFYASVHSGINQSDIFRDFMMYRNLFDIGIFFSLARQGIASDLSLEIAETIVDRILVDLSGEQDSLSGLYERAFDLVDEDAFVEIFDRAVSRIQ